ncbi:MAG TPA: L-threonylcarbamoyladenylate synthase [Vitreimonas sp.]|uniref:L-threonylcarbamoyladenylate synthase n=1 Tax=Vitreimonas sp. TaxID=3069702 RepID=UPI002D349BBB|nr:L-threonylcarbamoyladenylate synthase [Vitreimonas sp.]HYD89051.1 L-threonylcarbamoyladenylate synthase [Vitreimonas sp.]
MSIGRAAEILRAGGLVVFPTETVYGLGADAANPHAVARIYEAKGRPQFNPLIAHVPGLAEAEQHAHLHENALKLARAFWPGPFTVVARRRAESRIVELACAGLATVALRAPSHPMARELLAAFGGPIVAPSANRSGHVSATAAQHAAEDLGDRVDLVLDGGACPIGLESTIVAVGDDGEVTLLRPGAISRAQIEALVGPVSIAHGGKVQSPGMLESHYAPRARIRLDAEGPRPGEAYLAFGAPAPPGGVTLSARGDLVEAAANLYAALRSLDATGAETIAVAPIPAQGLGEAIRDRLARAAAPRS